MYEYGPSPSDGLRWTLLLSVKAFGCTQPHVRVIFYLVFVVMYWYTLASVHRLISASAGLIVFNCCLSESIEDMILGSVSLRFAGVQTR